MSRDELLGRTLLVADDDPDILTIVSSVLEVNGYLVLRARDGNEAQRILTDALPDLAIFDLSMPGKSGLELCKSLRAQPGGELVPVMILTARDGIEDKVVAFGEGADEYVTKPFNSTELLARVRALLRIRLLSLSLSERNEELKEMQARLVERERVLAVSQLAGAAAHNMGQPLSAILLNLHLMKQLSADDERYQKALAAIGFDARRMVELLEQMKKADPQSVSEYFGSTAILQLADESSEPVKSSDDNVVQLRPRRERT